MAITVRTNTSVSSVLTDLSKTSRGLNRSFERISSGLRIARAADDAAGLGVAESLRAAHTSGTVASRNVNDGISIISIAEGASEEVANILVRMRELAVQSSSETLQDDERAYVNDEYAALESEIDRIANVTEFNGLSLANGDLASGINVQVGINSGADNQINIELGSLLSSDLGISNIDLSSATGAQAALSVLDAAIDSVSGYRATFGATENRLNSALNNLETYIEASTAAESRIRDADFGYETAVLSQHQILQQAGVSILGQVKNLNQGALNLLNA
jgi:flagellin